MSVPGLGDLLVTHWRLSWPLVLQAAIVAGLYLWGVRRVHGRWPLRRTLSFLAGIATVLAALQSGLDGFDDRLLSVHMVQHMLLLLLAPLFLLGGHPLLLAMRALPGRRRAAIARGLGRTRRLTGPLPCLAVLYVVLLTTHLPAFYDAALRHPLVHLVEHVLYLGAGLMLWWPILDGEPVRAHRLGGLGRLVYMLAAMPPMALIGAYLNRHVGLVYASYGPAGHALGISALNDQGQAGAIMWVAGNTTMVIVGLWATITALVAAERRQQIRERRAGVPQRTVLP